MFPVKSEALSLVAYFMNKTLKLELIEYTLKIYSLLLSLLN